MQFHHPNRVKNYTFAAQQRAFPPTTSPSKQPMAGRKCPFTTEHLCTPPPLLANSRRYGVPKSLLAPVAICAFHWENPNLYSSNLRFPEETQVQLLSTLASPPGTSTAQWASSWARPLGRSQCGLPTGLLASGSVAAGRAELRS